MDNGKKQGRSSRFSRGRWEIERERCRIEEPYPSKGVEDPSSMSDVVPSLLKRLGLADEHWLGVMEAEWGKIVGEAVAKHTRPGRMENRKLTVFVDNSVWMSELARYGRPQMLANLQKRFGKDKITSVSLTLDPDDQRKGK